MLKIAGIVDNSIVDGPGLRLTIFTQGCKHHCKDCHNPQTWSFNGGKEISNKEIQQKFIDNPLLSGLTLSGGDPIEQAKECFELVQAVKKIKPYLHIICYTGYTLEELILKNDENINKLLKSINWLIDGKFEIENKSMACKWRGSSNQRIINMKKYFANKEDYIEIDG